MKRPLQRWLLVLSVSLAAGSVDARRFWDAYPSVSAFLNNTMSILINTDVAVNNTPVFGNVVSRFHLSTVREPGAAPGPGSEPVKTVANGTGVGSPAAVQAHGTGSADDDGTAVRTSTDVVPVTAEPPPGRETDRRGDGYDYRGYGYDYRGRANDGPLTTSARRVPTEGADPFERTGLNRVYERMVQDADYLMVNDVGRAANCFYCAAAAFRGCTVSALADRYGVDAAATAALDAESADRLTEVFGLVKSKGTRGKWYRDYMSLWNDLNERTGPGRTGAYALAYEDVRGAAQVVALRVRKERVPNARMLVLAVDYRVPAAPGEPLSGRFRNTVPYSDAYYLFVFDGARPSAENAAPTSGEDGDGGRSWRTPRTETDRADVAEWYSIKASSS
ncbi:uncharacterized protein LOC112693854 [Sipha flava]|uniref:Uncharacterized protein LOC112693854 n=1 Tax=Sipha flava TaxID=143950 RepID=A0A2S2QYH9_9HEMI|nr:uncharacterized protein LOC112693854 [Sipha flava]